MPIAPEDTFLVKPGQSRISRGRFRQVMLDLAAPAVLAERGPSDYYDAIEAARTPDGRCVDPLFVLAKFVHESGMGKAGMATTTRSWGNTRPPSFGVPEVGQETQFINGQPNGFFSRYDTWLDGCHSTCGRLVSPDWKYHARTTIREIYDHPSGDVWAPAGDFNNPAAYLRAVIDFMNAHADRMDDTSRGNEPIHILISAGHWDTTGDDWGGVEKVRTRPLAIAIADEAEHRGFRVTRQVEQFDGTYREVATWAAKQAETNGIRLLLQVHFEGTHPTVRGAFGIPPHQPARQDYDKDAERLGVDIVKRLKRATGMPIRNDGVMLESATNAGELAFFSRSTHLKTRVERLLVEFGASNSNLDDRAIVDAPRFNASAASATVDALEAFYGKLSSTRRVQRVKHLGLPDNVSDNPAAWHCGATNTWVTNPRFIDYYLGFGEQALSLFGLPVEGEVAIDDGNGGATHVQYFERARFEWHPAKAGTPFEVQLGRVGAELLEKLPQAQALQPMAPPTN
ncbi:MAG TPA: hypothetical protein VMM78_13905 [Thermomicrobiales bacterium]|nr:hypothetical protein [Thermomicrobiales bacterium]